MSVPTTDDLLERARSGDRAALEALLSRHQAQIYRFGMKMCRDPAETEADVPPTLRDSVAVALRDVLSTDGEPFSPRVAPPAHGGRHDDGGGRNPGGV